MVSQYILASSLPIRCISLSRRVTFPCQIFLRVLPFPLNSAHEKLKPTRKLSKLKGETFRASPCAVASRKAFINWKALYASKFSDDGTAMVCEPIDTMRGVG